MSEVIGGERRAGIRRTREQHQPALTVGLGGGQRQRVVDHRRREVARELDGGTKIGLTAEGAAVQQGPGFRSAP